MDQSDCPNTKRVKNWHSRPRLTCACEMEIKRTVKYESNPFIYVQVAGGSDGSLKLDFCHERF